MWIHRIERVRQGRWAGWFRPQTHTIKINFFFKCNSFLACKMRPRKEHLPCGISKIHLKRAYPEGQEDEGLLVESLESLRGPSALNSPTRRQQGVGYRAGRRDWWSGLSCATVMPSTTQETGQVSFAKILTSHPRVLGSDQVCRMQVAENKPKKNFPPKT